MTHHFNSAEAHSRHARLRHRRLIGYERVGLEMFARRGFSNVSVEAVARELGVSERTLFRYFPVKEDLLLGLPRRSSAATAEHLARLAPNSDPVRSAWQAIRTLFREDPVDGEVLSLWRAAAADAPEVLAKVRGERFHIHMDAFADYFARSASSASIESSPEVLGGMLAGIELAVVEAWRRSGGTLDDSFAEADAAIDAIARSMACDHRHDRLANQ